jgi:hypothetical protein
MSIAAIAVHEALQRRARQDHSSTLRAHARVLLQASSSSTSPAVRQVDFDRPRLPMCATATVVFPPRRAELAWRRLRFAQAGSMRTLGFEPPDRAVSRSTQQPASVPYER